MQSAGIKYSQTYVICRSLQGSQDSQKLFGSAATKTATQLKVLICNPAKQKNADVRKYSADIQVFF